MAGTDIDVAQLTRAAMARLTLRLRLTRAAIALERGARAFWPLIAFSLAALALLRFDLLPLMGRTGVLTALAAGGLFWLLLLGAGLRVFRWPTGLDARRRIDATLEGRPLQSLSDTQATGAADAGARYLWARHLERMAAAAENSRAALPVVRLAARDPWALRLLALLLLAAALLFGRADPVDRLAESLSPSGPVLASGPSWEGWAEPPAYTGKPSVYLNDIPSAGDAGGAPGGAAGGALILPRGTAITLRVYGATQAATLTETVTVTGGTTITPDDTGLAEVGFSVQRSGEVVLTPPGGQELRFRISMTADKAPEVALSGEISRSVQGEFQLPFRARDDYGVTGGTARITLALPRVDRRHGLAPAPEPRAPVTLDMPLPLSRDTSDFTEVVVEDLSRHPWAGLPVVITLTVADDLGQEGVFATEPTPMPGKRFFDTTAGALAELRRDLLWNRQNAGRVMRLLRAVTWAPETHWQDKPDRAYLMARTALRRLEYAGDALTPDTRDEVAEILWQAAILIEDGDLGDARARLRRAQERLSEAMRNGATPDEIQELMDALREATNDYIRQLAEEQRRDRDNRQADGGQDQGQQMTQSQLQQMMDRIQELMEQGRMAEAQELMRQLQQMMENMRVTEGGPGQGGEGNQAMEGLGDTLREQQDLADETYRQLQEEFRNSRPGQGEGQGQQQGQSQGGGQDPSGRPRREGRQGQGGQGPTDRQDGGQGQSQGQGQGQSQGDTSRQDLAERQRALRDMLNDQRRRLGNSVPDSGTGGGLGEQLDEAERQMGRAEQSLREGNEGEALDRQADAMEALREGMRQLNEEQRQAEGRQGGQQGRQPGRTGQQQRRDPLGRSLSESGEIGTEDSLLPGEDAYRRSREVMDEIRRRSGDRTRPQIELDYLKRLLDRF